MSRARDVRAWIDSFPRVVAPHAAALLRLLEAVDADPRVRALQVRGSLAWGTADQYSDLDTLMWISDEHYEATLAGLPSLARSIGRTLDILFETPGSPYLFVQFADGVQLELSARRSSDATGHGAGVVVLLDRDGLLEQPYEPPPAWDRHLWLGWAWMAVYDVDKYLRRESLWEALHALEKARSLLLRHHAAEIGVREPEFGVTSILDHGGSLPEGVEATIARLDAADIRRAAYACGELLTAYDRRPFADFVLARLRSD